VISRWRLTRYEKSVVAGSMHSIGFRVQRNLGWRVQRSPICVCHVPFISLTHLFYFLQARRTCLDDIIHDSDYIFNFKKSKGEGEAKDVKALCKGEVKDGTITLPYGIDESKESRSNALAASKCSSYGRSSTSTSSLFFQRHRELWSTAKGLHKKCITMVDKVCFYAGTYCFRSAIEVC
jgi:hypothetical protein